jgi:thiamine-monophosphate kinase
MSLPGEFELIRRYFAPLAGPGSLKLTDDAAVVDLQPGRSLVATTDTVIAGVHFLADDPPDLIARKALRVNLSDLASMGAEPLGYLLVTALPAGIDENWVAQFSRGLAQDQAEFSISLLGGDTAFTPGPLSLTITALGQVERGKALLRSGAKPGDRVYLSGTIGDSAFGLKLAKGEPLTLSPSEKSSLLDRYRLPQPRLGLGRRLIGVASAAMDVSDGFAADLGHICQASRVGALVEAAKLPVSPALRSVLEAGEASLVEVATGGDDYELLFTAPAAVELLLGRIATELALPLTAVGEIRREPGVIVLDQNGRAVELGPGGYRHF